MRQLQAASMRTTAILHSDWTIGFLMGCGTDLENKSAIFSDTSLTATTTTTVKIDSLQRDTVELKETFWYLFTGCRA